MKTHKQLYSTVLAATLLFLSGCKMMQPVQHTSSIKSPESFEGQTDSVGVGAMQWKTFFKDPNLTALIRILKWPFSAWKWQRPTLPLQPVLYFRL
jgi:multidrug efflux system outer membrane protein